MNEDLKQHLRKKLFEAFDPPFAADEAGDLEDMPSFSPVPKPYILSNGEYSWYPDSAWHFPPIRQLISPIENEFDRETNNILLWINTLNPDDITHQMLEWLIWVMANSNNMTLPGYMNPQIQDLVFEMVREYLNYRILFYGNYINQLTNVSMNNMDIRDRIRELLWLSNSLEAIFQSLNPWSEMVSYGIIDWPHLQHIMPDGWYPSSYEDQENFFNDPHIQHWPGMPLKPTTIPWWDVDSPSDPSIFDDEEPFI